MSAKVLLAFSLGVFGGLVLVASLRLTSDRAYWYVMGALAMLVCQAAFVGGMALSERYHIRIERRQGGRP